MSALEFIVPDWPAHAKVRAVTSTRAGGCSAGPYASLNLGAHVGDEPAQVAANRAQVATSLALPAAPVWLQQVHGVQVVDAAQAAPGATADGSYTDRAGVVCAVLTADCLPVFLCDRAGTRVAIVHAGWRGLAAGVIEQGLAKLNCQGADVLAWLGPAIGADAFVVGDDVVNAFVQADAVMYPAFRPTAGGRWCADIYALARRRLLTRGVTAIYGGAHCTVNEPQRFFSYRRDGVCGRMASLIWLQP